MRRLIGCAAGLCAAGLSLPATAAAQAAKPAEVTLVGCIELEQDYRARKEAGRGGFLGTGVGVGNEFVLSNAKPAPRARNPAPAGDYEITGRLEGDLLRQVGRQVEVIGTIEKAEKDGLPRVNVTLWHPVSDYCPAP